MMKFDENGLNENGRNQEMEDFVRDGYPGYDTTKKGKRLYRERFGEYEAEAIAFNNPRIFNIKNGQKNREVNRRISRDLSGDECENLYSAVEFANNQGVVMDVRISITWGLLGLADHTEADKAFMDNFIKPLRDWYSNHTNGQQLTYAYVHEVGRKRGFHTHLLMDIQLMLRKDFRKWMKKRLTNISLNGDLPKGTFDITCPPGNRIYRQWIGFQYMCKGLDEGAYFNAKVGKEPYVIAIDLISYNYKNPGEVLCKNKCGMSHNINKESRKRAGFKSSLEDGITDVRLLYSGMEFLCAFRRTEEGRNYPPLLNPYEDPNNPFAQRVKTPWIEKLINGEKEFLAIITEDIRNEKEDAKQRKRTKRELDGKPMGVVEQKQRRKELREREIEWEKNKKYIEDTIMEVSRYEWE